MTEDLAPFFADFAVPATLGGASLRAIIDTQTIDETGVATQEPSALVASPTTAAPDDTFVAAGVTYKVREVLKEPPDGAFTRLFLARA